MSTDFAETCASLGHPRLAARREGADAPPTPRSAQPEARDTCRGCVALRADVTAWRAEDARRLAALEAAIVNSPRLANLPPDDVGLLAALAKLGATFTARELANHAHVDAELRVALHGVTSPRKIGRRLHRLAGLDIGGYRLGKVDREAHGVIWSVESV